jgi:hypothetical protein
VAPVSFPGTVRYIVNRHPWYVKACKKLKLTHTTTKPTRRALSPPVLPAAALLLPLLRPSDFLSPPSRASLIAVRVGISRENADPACRVRSSKTMALDDSNEHDATIKRPGGCRKPFCAHATSSARLTRLIARCLGGGVAPTALSSFCPLTFVSMFIARVDAVLAARRSQRRRRSHSRVYTSATTVQHRSRQGRRSIEATTALTPTTPSARWMMPCILPIVCCRSLLTPPPLSPSRRLEVFGFRHRRSAQPNTRSTRWYCVYGKLVLCLILPLNTVPPPPPRG